MPKFAQAMLDELQNRGVSVLLDSAVTGLETQTEDKGQDRVTGVRFVQDGKTQFIRLGPWFLPLAVFQTIDK